MRNDKEIENIYDMIFDYYQSIKLEVERGGFGYDVYKSEERLLEYINSTPDDHKYIWNNNPKETQFVADLLDDCYNYLIANEDFINSKTKNYLQIFEFIVKCLNDIQYIQLTTSEPQQTVTFNNYQITQNNNVTFNNYQNIIEQTAGIEPQHGGQAPEPQAELQQEKEVKDLLPDILQTDEAIKIFQKAIGSKLIKVCSEGLKWNGTKQLLAYFATRVSEKFNLSTKLDKDGNKTTAWKPFEDLFREQNLKGAKQNWMRLNTRFEPTGFDKVDVLFE